jgi:hypothetical protein
MYCWAPPIRFIFVRASHAYARAFAAPVPSRSSITVSAPLSRAPSGVACGSQPNNRRVSSADPALVNTLHVARG